MSKNVKDPSLFHLADYEFHQEFYRQSENDFLINACQAFATGPFAYLLTHKNEFVRDESTRACSVAQHQQIIAALKEGSAKAVQVVGANLDIWWSTMLAFLEEEA